MSFRLIFSALFSITAAADVDSTLAPDAGNTGPITSSSSSELDAVDSVLSTLNPGGSAGPIPNFETVTDHGQSQNSISYMATRYMKVIVAKTLTT